MPNTTRDVLTRLILLICWQTQYFIILFRYKFRHFENIPTSPNISQSCLYDTFILKMFSVAPNIHRNYLDGSQCGIYTCLNWNFKLKHVKKTLLVNTSVRSSLWLFVEFERIPEQLIYALYRINYHSKKFNIKKSYTNCDHITINN